MLVKRATGEQTDALAHCAGHQQPWYWLEISYSLFERLQTTECQCQIGKQISDPYNLTSILICKPKSIKFEELKWWCSGIFYLLNNFLRIDTHSSNKRARYIWWLSWVKKSNICLAFTREYCISQTHFLHKHYIQQVAVGRRLKLKYQWHIFNGICIWRLIWMTTHGYYFQLFPLENNIKCTRRKFDCHIISTHCDLMMLYGITELGQHWFTFITWINVHEWGIVAFSRGQFHKKWSRYPSLIENC